MSLNRRRFIRTSAGAIAGISLWGCGRNSSPANIGSKGSRTTVFLNGTVLPVDHAFSEHSAIVTKNERILAVGSDEDMLALAGRDAETIQLDGRVVLPGFIEPHMHFALMAGLGHLRDIGPFENPTFDDALKAIREIKDSSAGEWVMARQFDPILLEPPRDLTIRELDEIVPNRPVFVLNASGHIAYVNSKSIEMAGITRDSMDPPGGEIGRYQDGSPNGVLYGQAGLAAFDARQW